MTKQLWTHVEHELLVKSSECIAHPKETGKEGSNFPVVGWVGAIHPVVEEEEVELWQWQEIKRIEYYLRIYSLQNQIEGRSFLSWSCRF